MLYTYSISGGIYIANSTFDHIGTGVSVILLDECGDGISITNCTFTDTVLGVRCASFVPKMSNETSISITDSTFQNVRTVDQASVMFFRDNTLGTIYISRCTFQINNGGALSISEYAGSHVTIKDCTFLNNKAQYGGAVLIISKGTFLIVNSTFVNPGINAIATIEL